ncbi:MAG: hypothetical protein KAH32_05365 [Chlamydiia bacterium]|nr:hypothetical protein [Chlamydiia bacterium]
MNRSSEHVHSNNINQIFNRSTIGAIRIFSLVMAGLSLCLRKTGILKMINIVKNLRVRISEDQSLESIKCPNMIINDTSKAMNAFKESKGESKTSMNIDKYKVMICKEDLHKEKAKEIRELFVKKSRVQKLIDSRGFNTVTLSKCAIIEDKSAGLIASIDERKGEEKSFSYEYSAMKAQKFKTVIKEISSLTSQGDLDFMMSSIFDQESLKEAEEVHKSGKFTKLLVNCKCNTDPLSLNGEIDGDIKIEIQNPNINNKDYKIKSSFSIEMLRTLMLVELFPIHCDDIIATCERQGAKFSEKDVSILKLVATSI